MAGRGRGRWVKGRRGEAEGQGGMRFPSMFAILLGCMQMRMEDLMYVLG